MTTGIRISFLHASDMIIAQAKESADELIAQGWDITEKCGRHYDLGTYWGDAETLAEKLGRKPTKSERISLENQIREHLDAVFDCACPDFLPRSVCTTSTTA